MLVAIALLTLAAALLLARTAFGISTSLRRFAHRGPVGCPLTDTQVGGLAEDGTRCRVGADHDNLYLLRPDPADTAWWERLIPYRTLAHDLALPWSDIVWSEGQGLLQGRILVAIKGSPIQLQLPHELAQRVRRQAP